jgi:thymidine phosphorylase
MVVFYHKLHRVAHNHIQPNSNNFEAIFETKIAHFSALASAFVGMANFEEIQWRLLIVIADNVINWLLLSKSVVPKHSI